MKLKEFSFVRGQSYASTSGDQSYTRLISYTLVIYVIIEGSLFSYLP